MTKPPTERTRRIIAAAARIALDERAEHPAERAAARDTVYRLCREHGLDARRYGLPRDPTAPDPLVEAAEGYRDAAEAMSRASRRFARNARTVRVSFTAGAATGTYTTANTTSATSYVQTTAVTRDHGPVNQAVAQAMRRQGARLYCMCGAPDCRMPPPGGVYCSTCNQPTARCRCSPRYNVEGSPDERSSDA